MNLVNDTQTMPKDWDKSLRQLGGSIVQSAVWCEFQQQLGRQVVWKQGSGWQWLGVVRRSKGLNYLMCSYGPAAKDAAAMRTAVASMQQEAQQLGLDFIRLEPQRFATKSSMQKLGAVKISESSPTHTQVLDLRLSEDKLRSNLASGHRNLINGTERRGITITESTNQETLNLFTQMLDDTARRSGVVFYPASYYQTLLSAMPDNLHLYRADVNGDPVATALFYDWQGVRYYAHAGAFQQKNRQAKASVSLVWQAIMDAKDGGLQTFDLWGTAPMGEDSHPLAGITKFKQAFGGQQVDYVGTWDLPLKKQKYRLYTMYRRLRGRG